MATKNENRKAFIISVFDLVNAHEPNEIIDAAKAIWAKLFNDPDLVQPFDNQILNDFVELKEKRVIAFARDMRRALDTYIFPALKGEILINVDLSYNLTNQSFKRSDLNIFHDVKIHCLGNDDTKKTPIAHIPLLAVEAYFKLAVLPNGTKICSNCNNLFFNTRKNMRFCSDKCRSRFHYEKLKKGDE